MRRYQVTMAMCEIVNDKAYSRYNLLLFTLSLFAVLILIKVTSRAILVYFFFFFLNFHLVCYLKLSNKGKEKTNCENIDDDDGNNIAFN